MNSRWIAYFSMEIGIQSDVPTYSGGLGILAGDTLRAAADLAVPMLAFTLLHRKGYFRQHLDASGWQREEAADWVVETYLEELSPRVSLTLEDRTVRVRAWKYNISGVTDHVVPVFFLDTDLPENTPWDRTLTDHLYGGDDYYRLCQEVVLGVGGVRMARALGYEAIERFHMNEGHAALLTMELLDETANAAGRQSVTRADIENVRERCVFTTHTPVPAGHDQFPLDMVRRVIGRRDDFFDMKDQFSVSLDQGVLQTERAFRSLEEMFRGEHCLNMTYLALNLSGYINGVAKSHGEASRHMFAGYTINAITNGVHAATWTSAPFKELYDRYIPGWKQDNFSLRSALTIPEADIWDAHTRAKATLIEAVNGSTGSHMDSSVLTLGFARRSTGYKRADLLFTDIERLRKISANVGRLQVLYAGKAHPRDQTGKDIIQRIFRARDALSPDVRVSYLENYDMGLAKLLTSGVDIWLNTPEPPMEASGTSGMKSALNGVPSFSVRDGWWIEGHIEGVTGWSIGTNDRSQDAASLYGKLEHVIAPAFYRDRSRFVGVMREAIAYNGSFFNTQRMVQQYVVNAYSLKTSVEKEGHVQQARRT